MRKSVVLSILLLLALLAGLLSGCTSAAPTAALIPSPTPLPPTVPPGGSISFMVFGDPAELKAYQDLVQAFEAKFTSVKVELIHVPSQGDYRTRLAADFAAGTPADVVLINYRRYAAFAAKGVLEPLGPYLNNSPLLQEKYFYKEAREPFRWQGVLQCIPQNISSLVVYYNQSLFDAAGQPYPQADWTWEEFLQTAQALTQDTDGDGHTDQFGLGTEASIFRVAPFIWQNQGDLVDNPLDPTKLILDSPEALEAVQWFVDLQVKHHVVPSQEEEAAQSSEDRFQAGTLAMFLNSRRGVPTYREITAFDWDVAALPRHLQPAGILHADAYCMAKVSKNKAAAWAFIEYANSPEGQTLVAGSGRTVPSLIRVAESEAFLDPNAKPANSRVFLDTIPFIRGVPVISTWVDIEEIAGEELERAFYGHASVEEAMQTAIQRSDIYFSGEE